MHRMNATPQSIGLLILRLGLGGFLLLWSVNKLVAPEGTVSLYQYFYRLDINTHIAYTLGILEAVLSLAIMAGFLKTYSYALGMVLHAISTVATYQQLLHPFGQYDLFMAALPVLAAFIALFLLRRQDMLCSLDEWLRSSERVW
jgi:putative oxidoreductase